MEEVYTIEITRNQIEELLDELVFEVNDNLGEEHRNDIIKSYAIELLEQYCPTFTEK